LLPHEILLLELYRRQHVVGTMLARTVVKHLDVIEHILPAFVARQLYPAPDPLTFQQLEEVLHQRVVMAVAAPANMAARETALPRLGTSSMPAAMARGANGSSPVFISDVTLASLQCADQVSHGPRKSRVRSAPTGGLRHLVGGPQSRDGWR
jgi:hypothetical protein